MKKINKKILLPGPLRRSYIPRINNSLALLVINNLYSVIFAAFRNIRPFDKQSTQLAGKPTPVEVYSTFSKPLL